MLLIIGGAVAALYFYYSKPQPGTARIAALEEEDRAALFIARFDSLTDARLHRIVWRSGTFLRTSFDDTREQWTLTISSADWASRDEDSKRDLLATLVSAFKGTRAQAGGDPEQAVLTLIDEEGDDLAKVSGESGIVILR
jgi:hypothetical protein